MSPFPQLYTNVKLCQIHFRKDRYAYNFERTKRIPKRKPGIHQWYLSITISTMSFLSTWLSMSRQRKMKNDSYQKFPSDCLTSPFFFWWSFGSRLLTRMSWICVVKKAFSVFCPNFCPLSHFVLFSALSKVLKPTDWQNRGEPILECGGRHASTSL